MSNVSPLQATERHEIHCQAFLVLSLSFAGPACAQEPASVANAKAAASSWLALTDAGDYSKSWEQASSLFKAAVSEAAWSSAVQAARSPLGALKSRTFKSTTLTHFLPGAPDGEYIVIRYESQFEHKAAPPSRP